MLFGLPAPHRAIPKVSRGASLHSPMREGEICDQSADAARKPQGDGTDGIEAMTGKRLLIVAHAPSPNTERLRAAVQAGARSPEIEGVAVASLGPFAADAKDVLAANAIILGTTENLGYMSGALKDFFDRCYYPCLERTEGLPYALFIRAGHDGTGTRRSVETIVTGLRWRRIQEPLICRGPWREDFVAQCRDLGTLVAAGLEAGVF